MLVKGVFESLVRGETNLGDRNSTRRVVDLRILAYIAHQNYLVDAFRHDMLQLLKNDAWQDRTEWHSVVVIWN